MSYDVVALYRRAWTEVQPHLVSWVLLYTVFIGVSLLSCGFAIVFMPNVQRELRDSRRDGRPPEFGAIFQTQNLANDAVNGLLYMAALSVGGMLGGIGAYVAAVALQLLMPLAADDRHGPVDNIKLSAQHAMKHPVDHLLVFAVGAIAGTVAIATFCLALPVVAPIIGMAHQLFYEDNRDELDTLAKEMGLLTTGAPPASP